MAWEIEVSDEFATWYEALNEDENESVTVAIDFLADQGPALRRPLVGTLRGSKLSNLRELVVQHDGRPLRVLFAFDPRRVAYIILGGDKTGDASWYETFIPTAERIYKQHLKEL